MCDNCYGTDDYDTGDYEYDGGMFDRDKNSDVRYDGDTIMQYDNDDNDRRYNRSYGYGNRNNDENGENESMLTERDKERAQKLSKVYMSSDRENVKGLYTYQTTKLYVMSNGICRKYEAPPPPQINWDAFHSVLERWHERWKHFIKTGIDAIETRSIVIIPVLIDTSVSDALEPSFLHELNANDMIDPLAWMCFDNARPDAEYYQLDDTRMVITQTSDILRPLSFVCRLFASGHYCPFIWNQDIELELLTLGVILADSCIITSHVSESTTVRFAVRIFHITYKYFVIILCGGVCHQLDTENVTPFGRPFISHHFVSLSKTEALNELYS